MEKISSKVVYKNPWWKVREDAVIRPDGTKGTYCIVENNASVQIIALSDKKELYLIHQYRYVTNKSSWEIPGGQAPALPLLKQAKLELGGRDWYGRANLEKDWCDSGAKCGPGAKSFFGEIKKMIRTGEISHSQSIVSIMFFIISLK